MKRKMAVIAFTSAGIAAGYYYASQRLSPAKVNPDTLTRAYLDGTISTSEKICQPGRLSEQDKAMDCALSAFETAAKFYIHWNNSVSQDNYKSVIGTVFGKAQNGFNAAKLKFACYDSRNDVDKAATPRAQLNTVIRYIDTCAGEIQNQTKETTVSHQIQPADFEKLMAIKSHLDNFYTRFNVM